MRPENRLPEISAIYGLAIYFSARSVMSSPIRKLPVTRVRNVPGGKLRPRFCPVHVAMTERVMAPINPPSCLTMP